MAMQLADATSKWRDFKYGQTAQQIYACRKPVIAIEGPLGTGKSSIFCHYIAAHCAENPGAIWIVVRRTYPMLRDNTLRTWREWFPVGDAGDWHEQKFTFMLDCPFFGRRAQGEIRFRAAENNEDVDKFMGGEYAGFVLEEVTGTYQESGGLKEDIYTGLLTRLRQTGIKWACEICRAVLPEALVPTDRDQEYTDCPACQAKKRVRIRYHALLVFNPPNPGHWVDQAFPLPAKEADEYAHFRLSRADNVNNLPHGYYQRLTRELKLKGDWAARYLDGERVPIGRATCVFDTDQIYKALGDDQWAVEASAQGVLERNKETLQVQLQKHPKGPLRVWHPPEKPEKDQYVIGVDAGEGLEDGDASCAAVLSRSTGALVAEWHGHLGPRRFGKELAMLGWWYNDAYIAVETEPSAAGRTVCNTLEEIGYSNLYMERKEDRIGDPLVRRYGLPMGYKQKERIVARGREVVEDHEFRIPSRELLLEMLTFVYRRGDSLREHWGADIGCHDDRVMAWLVALEAYERKGKFSPAPPVGKAPDWMWKLMGLGREPAEPSRAWMGM